jgi:hypothetical protein
MVVVDPDLVNALQGEIGVAPDGMCSYHQTLKSLPCSAFLMFYVFSDAY